MNGIVQKAGGFEELFPVLMIIAVIISQIIKAKKKLRNDVPPVLPPDGTRPEPRDELREFLNALSGGMAPAPPQPPPAQEVNPTRVPRQGPVARTPPPPPVAAVAPAARTVRRKAPKPVAPVPKQQPARVVTPVVKPQPTPVHGMRVQCEKRDVSPELSTVMADLGDRRSLARAFVLREVLDVPLSIRTTDVLSRF